MSENKQQDHDPIWRAMTRFAAASVGASVAEIATLPVDIGKVRLQLQKPLPDGTMRYKNMFQAGYRVGMDEGLTALWKGTTPALTRQISYTGLSLVFYEPIRNAIAGDTPVEELGFMWRLLAGGTAGGVSIAMVNPTDVVKTQMQNSTDKLKMAPIIQRIWATDGLRGFWSGVQPNVARCFIGNACELGFYDTAKTYIIKSDNIPIGDGRGAHFAAASFAGLLSALASCPVDVVRTRLFNQAGRATQEYKGTLDALINIPRREGFMSLYNGFAPLFTRKVVWTVLFFLSYEQAKLGLGYTDDA